MNPMKEIGIDDLRASGNDVGVELLLVGAARLKCDPDCVTLPDGTAVVELALVVSKRLRALEERIATLESKGVPK